MNTIIFISLGISLLVGLIVVLILAPTKTTRFTITQENNLEPTLAKLLKMFGGDISSLIPNNIEQEQIQSKRIDKLFRESDNPWKITKQEFLLIRIILLFLGAILGVFLFGFFAAILEIATIGILLGATLPIIFFMIPVSHYESVSKERNMKFKAQLPEAIDFLTMAVSSGNTLPLAFEETIGYLQDGIVKEEFINIVSDLRSGKTLETSLLGFADRAPTEGVRAFTKALINANKQSVSMVEIMRARAQASRRDLEMEIESRIAKLPTKVTMTFSPTASLTVITIALAPAIKVITRIL